MYLHIGAGVILETSRLVAIIGIKFNNGTNKTNMKLIKRLKQTGKLIEHTALENARCIIISDEYAHISSITPSALAKRNSKFKPRG